MLPAIGRQHRRCIILTGIINKPLLLHLVGCLYYLYQWCTVKQISDNEICLLIKYIKSFLWRLAKCLSYIEEARCLKVNHRLCNVSAYHTICQNYFNTSQSILYQDSYKHLFCSVLLCTSPPYSLLSANYSFERFIYSIPTIQLVINDFFAKQNLYGNFFIVAPCILICTVHSPTNALSLIYKNIKIYIKIHINIAPTCFGLRPSSGSLQWTWLKLYLC